MRRYLGIAAAAFALLALAASMLQHFPWCC